MIIEITFQQDEVVLAFPINTLSKSIRQKAGNSTQKKDDDGNARYVRTYKQTPKLFLKERYEAIFKSL